MFKFDLHHLPYADEDVRKLAHIATGEISEGKAYERFMRATSGINEEKIYPFGGVTVYLAEQTQVAWGYTGANPGLEPSMTEIAEPKTCAFGNLYIWTLTDTGSVPGANQPKHAFNLISSRATAYMKKFKLRRMTDEVYEIMYGDGA